MNARLTPQNRLQAEELLNQFMQQFPNAFVNSATATVHPLKLNIHQDLHAVFADQHSRKAIARAVTLYVNTPEYNNSLQTGAIRIDLTGQPCGEVTQQQAQQPNDRYQRFLKRNQRFAQRGQRTVPNIDNSNLDALVSSHLDLVVKITVLPQQPRTTTNGWQEFHLEFDGHLIRVTVRPKVWKKLQQISERGIYWIAIIRGKKGMKIGHNGFELLEPLVQLFERQASEHEISQANIAMNHTPNVTVYKAKSYTTTTALTSNNLGNSQSRPSTLHLRERK